MEGPPQPLDYASSKDWLDIMKNRSKLRMHELIERLGLRAKWSQNKRGKTNFESALIRDFVTDMGDVVSTLPKESDELVKFLSAEGSMNEQVEELLQKHGSAIWGRLAGENREHLISAGEEGVDEWMYPRDLYFENEEDRAVIRRLIHWWLGMKAINVILARERLDRERKKKEENKKARIELETQDAAASSFVRSLAPNAETPTAPMLNTNVPPIQAGEPPRHVQVYQVENLSRDSPISTSIVTPPEPSESPVVPARGSMPNSEAGHLTAINTNTGQAIPVHAITDGVWDRVNASRNGSISSQGASSWSAANTSQQTADRRRSSLAMEMTHLPQAAASVSSSAIRQLGADISQLALKLTPEYVSANGHTTTGATAAEYGSRDGAPYRGLDEDTLRALRAYIYGEESKVQWDETSLLLRIETIWRTGVRGDYTRITDNIGVFIARERAMLAWIELKRHLADLDRADRRWRSEGTTAVEIERRIQQHRTLMGATRELLRNYEDLSHIAGTETNNDELLRQAFVVLAGSKYAVEMQWKTVVFMGEMDWLANSLETHLRDEAEHGESSYFVG
ncbi:hypothetical protein P280DRAFT_487333 [Massarina eburnea CBS 473.64]|uniref:Uncharacterized protein n=1 Tax=Massarina eburnea CBS 473.64 TaxID=1395130 RepID=A0A6A6SAL5_9PLEO|nr:hypothetical protein P280DRAFT_487333 [Massarina eburnea CBS 473.64]